MSLDNPKLRDLLKKVDTGALQLPDFQREWKWDDERIRALIATVTLNYPLGVAMTLQTGGEPKFKARTLSGAEAASAAKPELLLLDGQQRLTSLFQALFRDEPVETVDARGKDLKRWYYIDIAKAIGSPSERDEAIVSVPEDRILKRNSARNALLDLSTKEKECAAGYFPLNVVFDTKRVNEWQRAFVNLDGANWDHWSQFEEHVLNHVQAFNVPMINLPAQTTMDAVCAVFERVNTGGVPLNVFELLTATYAGDRKYRADSGAYYELPEEWKSIKTRLASRYQVLGNLEVGLDDGLSSSDFLQAVALLRTWEMKQENPRVAVSCKRRDLLELPLEDFSRLAPSVADAFEWVGSFLRSQCIVLGTDLPYRTQLVPLAAVRAIVGKATDTADGQERITQWYWNGVLGEMYGGSLETRFTRDVEQLVAWIRREPGSVPDTVRDAVFRAERLDSLITRNSAAYKGIYALLIKQGAVDWYFTDAPLNSDKVVTHAVDIRQIFPKSWTDKNPSQHSKKVNSIVNKTPLSSRAGRSIAGPPASYLKALQLDSGVREEWFDDIVTTHLVDTVALYESDFDKFYEDRAKQLLELVWAAMGKRRTVFFRDETAGEL